MYVIWLVSFPDLNLIRMMPMLEKYPSVIPRQNYKSKTIEIMDWYTFFCGSCYSSSFCRMTRNTWMILRWGKYFIFIDLINITLSIWWNHIIDWFCQIDTNNQDNSYENQPWLPGQFPPGLNCDGDLWWLCVCRAGLCVASWYVSEIQSMGDLCTLNIACIYFSG